MNSPLDNYLALRDKVDSLCGGIHDILGPRITCAAGCNDCCQSITLFPVEAGALRRELESLPAGQAAAIRRHVAETAGGEACPLLSDGLCLLYRARPIICRTHGLPILYDHDGRKTVDCCPLNSLEGVTLSGAAVIDLERLNTLLATVNALYLNQSGLPEQPQRIPIAEAVLTP